MGDTPVIIMDIPLQSCRPIYMYNNREAYKTNLYTSKHISSGKSLRTKSKSGAVVKHQRMFVVLKATSRTKWLFKSGTAPLHHSLVTSLLIESGHLGHFTLL